MDKEIIVMGDIEMGAGNLTDAFISDRALAEVIRSLAQKETPVDLVLNGDTFDFLKCPSQIVPTTVYPRHITKTVSLAKLELIYHAHRSVFDAVKEFVSVPNHLVYFILGNHDQDLVYPEVQQEIQRLLGNTEQVVFPGLHYEQHQVYVEHGHQYDFLFQMNYQNIFLKHKGDSILNFPFVTFGLIDEFMRLNEQHPFLERIFPRPALLTHHRVIAREVNKRTMGYFLKSLLYYPFRFYSDPTYTFPTNIIRQLFRRIKTLNWDVDDITSIFRKKAKLTRNKIYVLGHIHEKYLQKKKNQVIIHPGSWRDEYDFNPKTRELLPRMKRYVTITVTNNQPTYQLIDLPLHRSIFGFDDVLRQEKKYIQLAGQEEGYSAVLH